jgi:predicted Zn-dependent peptidase
MRCRCCLIAVIVVAAIVQGGASNERAVQTFMVPGGVRAFVIPTTSLVSELVISIEAGTHHESPDVPGAAAHVAASILEGTWSGQSIRHWLAQHGVVPEIAVGQTATTFSFIAPSGEILRVIPYVAAVLSRDFTKEASWNASTEEDGPYGHGGGPWICASERFRRLVWEDDDSKRRVAPSRPSRYVLEEFWRRHYRRDRMLVAVSSADVSATRSAIRIAFAGAPSTDTGAPPPASRQARPQAVTRQVPSAGAPFLIAGHAIPVASPDDFFAAQLLAGVLGNGLSSRLYHRLRVRESLVYTVEATASPMGGTHVLLQISCQTEFPQRVLRVVEQELASITTTAVAPNEFDAAVAILRSRLRMDRASVRASLYQRLSHDQSSSKRSSDGGLRWLERLSRDGLLAAARRLLRPQALVAVIGVDANACSSDLTGCELCR